MTPRPHAEIDPERPGRITRHALAAGRASRVPALLFPLLLLALVCVGPGCAPTSGPPAEAPAARPARPTLREAMRSGPVAADPLFWRVAADGGATLHLLGSIHFGPPYGWQMPPTVLGAFAASEALVVEADERGVDEAEMQSIMLRYALAPAGSTLADLVPAETFEALEAHFAARGQSVDALMPFRPWMVATALTVGTISELGFATETGVDRSFLRQSASRDVIALETVDSQLAIFGHLSPELEALFLQDTLGQVADAEEMIVGMAEAWREGDEATLALLLVESFDKGDEFEALHDALIVDRNRAMAERLAALARDERLAGDDVFVVIGAAHFVGDENVREMLTSRYGLVVSRVPATDHDEPR